jgi:hypothetical protein
VKRKRKPTVDEFGNRFVNGRWIVERKQAIAAYRRVLKMVNGFLKVQKQDLLVTDGRGLMTWKEIRYHINAVLRMKIKPERRAASPEQEKG